MSEASIFSVFTTRSEIFAPNLNTRLNLLLKNNKKNHNHKASLFLSDHRTCPRYTSQRGPWRASWTPLSFSRAFAYALEKSFSKVPREGLSFLLVAITRTIKTKASVRCVIFINLAGKFVKLINLLLALNNRIFRPISISLPFS